MYYPNNKAQRRHHTPRALALTSEEAKMTHNVTPRRALRLVHFVRAALAFEASSGHLWELLAADVEQWALASLAGRQTGLIVVDSDGSAYTDVSSYCACVLAKQVRAFCGFTA